MAHFAQFIFQLLDILTFLTDDDTRFRCKDAHFDLAGSSFDFNAIDAGMAVFRFDKLFDAKILFEPLRIITFFTPL